MLTFVRALHTVIYVVMVMAILAVLYGGVTGRTGPWLIVALVLILIEAVVFIGNGMKCPLTAIAVRYGATKEGAYDTFFPERFTRHTLTVFGPLMLLALAMVVWRWLT